jgi:hypothetical protein
MTWSVSPGMTWDLFETLLTTLAPKFAPLTQTLLAKDTLATHLGLSDPAMLGDMDPVLAKTLLDVTIQARQNKLELEKIEHLLTTLTKVPKQTRDGAPLSPSWRLKKTLENPTLNLKRP